MEFHLDTINRRLDVLGSESDRTYGVDLPDDIKFTAVPRKFLSDVWGGGTQKTFPPIRKELLAVHGLDDWMYPNSKYNPHCPLIPGCAGLMFSPDGLTGTVDLESEQIWRTIVRLIDHAHWQYVGQYIRIGAPSLTKEEWLAQDAKVTSRSRRASFRVMSNRSVDHAVLFYGLV